MQRQGAAVLTTLVVSPPGWQVRLPYLLCRTAALPHCRTLPHYIAYALLSALTTLPFARSSSTDANDSTVRYTARGGELGPLSGAGRPPALAAPAKQMLAGPVLLQPSLWAFPAGTGVSGTMQVPGLNKAVLLCRHDCTARLAGRAPARVAWRREVHSNGSI